MSKPQSPVRPTLVNATTTPTLVLHELADASTAFGVPSLSPFCLKTHLTLQALGYAYTRAHGAHPGVWTALNPTGQVPVLVVDGEAIADSTAIADWLWRGAGREENAEAFLWEEFADAELNAFVVAARWLDDNNWPAVRDAYFQGAPAPIKAIVSRQARARVERALQARDVWRRGSKACWGVLSAWLMRSTLEPLPTGGGVPPPSPAAPTSPSPPSCAACRRA